MVNLKSRLLVCWLCACGAPCVLAADAAPAPADPAPVAATAATAPAAPAPTTDPAQLPPEQVYEALHNGARLYAEKAYQDAYPHLMIAAKRGFPQAQAQVGYLHLSGDGNVKRDSRLALGWLGAAASGESSVEIRKAFRDALDKVPPEHVPAYQKIVDQFIAKYGAEAQHLRCESERRLGSTVGTLQCRLVGADGNVVQDAYDELDRNSSSSLSGENAIRDMQPFRGGGGGG